MEVDGFVLVGKQRRRRRGGPRNAAAATAVVIENGDAPSVEAVDDAVARCSRQIEAQFREGFLSRVNLALAGRRVSVIRTIGVGNFGERESPAAYQMAMLKQLHARLETAAEVVVQEPRLTNNEREWLQRQGFQILPSDDLAVPRLVDDDVGSVCVCLMIHCGHALYNSLLFAHWQPRLLHRLVIIGNSLRDLVIPRKHEHELPFVAAFRRLCDEVAVPGCIAAPTAFNDTVVQWARRDAILTGISSDCVPVYQFYANEIIFDERKKEEK